MSLKNKAIRGAKWTMLQEIASQFIDFLIIIILARLLGPKEFGLVAIATVIISSMRPFVALGMGAAITQRSTIEAEHLDTAFWSTFVFGCVLAPVLAISAGQWAAAFSEPELTAVLRWLSVSLIFVAMTTVQEAILRRELNFKVYAVRTVIGKIVGGAIGVTLAFADFGVWSLVARLLATAFVSVLLLWGISNWRPRFRFSPKHFKQLFSFGIPMTLNELLSFVKLHSDSLLINYFLGTIALGYYNMAFRLMTLTFRLISQTVSRVGMPTFARLQQDREGLWNAFYSVTQLIALIAFPIFLGMLAIAPEMVIVLLGDQWLNSIPVLRILLLIGIVHCLLTPMITLLVGVGKPGIRLKLQAVDSLANLIGFSIAVHWGIVGVAVSYVVVGYALFPVWYWVVNRVTYARSIDYFKAILGPLLITGVMMLEITGVRWLALDTVGNLSFVIIAVVTGALLYICLVYWLLPSTASKTIDMVKTLIGARKTAEP